MPAARVIRPGQADRVLPVLRQPSAAVGHPPVIRAACPRLHPLLDRFFRAPPGTVHAPRAPGMRPVDAREPSTPGVFEMPFRIKSVLAASDLSGNASEVLRTAGALAALTGAELHVVHAAETAGAEGAAGERPSADGGRRLEEAVRNAVPGTVEVTSAYVAAGRGHEVILRRADEVRADLLVIGPHRGGEVRQVLGTTADRLVRTSDVPCLIVHGEVSLPLRRVLVPSDLSDAACGALDLALIWAAALRMPSGSGEQTRVQVLNVLPKPAPRTGAPDPAGAAGAARALADQVAAAKDRTGVATLLEVEHGVAQAGSPADEILRRATELEADLLVLGTHGESALSRTLVGSVSSAVARRAGCPVLLVPPALWKTRQARETGVQPEI